MKAKNKINMIQANTEPSQIGNDLEGVETTKESLRDSMVSILQEQSPMNNGRYSPILQETVSSEDKEPQTKENVVYAPYIPYLNLRHYQVTGNENSVNCWKHRCISKYSAKKAA